MVEFEATVLVRRFLKSRGGPEGGLDVQRAADRTDLLTEAFAVEQHQPPASLRSLLTRVKALTPPEEQKCVVYRVPCECGSVYVGETGRQMKTGIEEHKKAVMKADPNNAIAEHMWSTGHKIQWDETTSIDHDGDWFRRRIKEALHVKSSNAMSTGPGFSLNPCWTASRTAPL